MVEGIRADRLQKGRLVSHLIELALRLFFIEQDKVSRRQGRLRQDILQLPAYQRGGSGDRNLVHRYPFPDLKVYRDSSESRFDAEVIVSSPGAWPGRLRRRRDHEYAARAQMPENIYVSATTKSTTFE